METGAGHVLPLVFVGVVIEDADGAFALFLAAVKLVVHLHKGGLVLGGYGTGAADGIGHVFYHGVIAKEGFNDKILSYSAFINIIEPEGYAAAFAGNLHGALAGLQPKLGGL